MDVIVNSVSFSYGSSKVLDNLSCVFNSNMISAVVGKNGSGKSTFLDIIDHLLVPLNGNVKIGDLDFCGKSVGYLFQFSEDQIFNSTVYKEIEFGLKCFKCDNVKQRIVDALKLVDLDESYLERNPYKLSNGERRKVSMASVLAYDPAVLIFDEPTLGLDNRSKLALISLIRNLKRNYNKTIIIVSHDTDFLHKFVDFVYLLKDGLIYKKGTKYEIFSNENLMNECGLKVPDVLHFSNVVMAKKNIKIGYRDDINDLIKDVYRYVN